MCSNREYYKIQKTQVSTLHHLATTDEGEMLPKVFLTQWKYPAGKGEWTEQDRHALKEFGLAEDLDWIRSNSRESFKTLVRNKTEEIALEELNKAKGSFPN